MSSIIPAYCKLDTRERGLREKQKPLCDETETHGGTLRREVLQTRKNSTHHAKLFKTGNGVLIRAKDALVSHVPTVFVYNDCMPHSIFCTTIPSLCVHKNVADTFSSQTLSLFKPEFRLMVFSVFEMIAAHVRQIILLSPRRSAKNSCSFRINWMVPRQNVHILSPRCRYVQERVRIESSTRLLSATLTLDERLVNHAWFHARGTLVPHTWINPKVRDKPPNNSNVKLCPDT